jgi:hypothetical protein
VTRRILAVIAVAAALPARVAWGMPASGLGGTWVAAAGSGKIVLVLHKTGAVYKGTYTELPPGKTTGKPSKVVAHATNADGVQQITLTFTGSNRSTLCGLRTGHIYCSVPTGTAIFSRR